jgi:uncharacterized protein YjeT (DUF2065 family)
MFKPAALYIETKIRCDLDTLWRYTQDPALHEQWDLRFTSITYLTKSSTEATQKFTYATKIGFGLAVEGVGESVATKSTGSGENISVLKFWSDSSLSLIKVGSGYWKYVVQPDGIRFFTGYDYTTRWGFFGKWIDRMFFRPLIRTATAISFDALKNWIERGIHPKQAYRAKLTVLIATLALSLVWIYHGLVPKILFPQNGEIALFQASHLFVGEEALVVRLIGVGEILFGLLLLFWQRKALHIVNMLALGFLGFSALISNRTVATYPFNPVTFNFALIVLSLVAIVNMHNLPKARNCITRPRP